MAVSKTIQRRLAWIDTDASGIWHYSTVIRFAEAVEGELHRELGISEFTFGALPRVHIEFDFKRPVAFDELVSISLTVASVGSSSLTYDLELSVDGDLVANGKIVTVLLDRQTQAAAPWPDEIRAKLEGA